MTPYDQRSDGIRPTKLHKISALPHVEEKETEDSSERLRAYVRLALEIAADRHALTLPEQRRTVIDGVVDPSTSQ